MGRPVDWTPLGYDSDPVPGRPERVRTMGKHYQEVADAIDEAATKLRAIADSDMVSQAVAQFRDSCDQVADDISRAHTRYRGVGDALVTYAPALEYAQEESAAALRAAEDAQEEIRTSKAGLDRLEEADDPDAGAISRTEGRLADAETALTRAKSRAEEAVRHRDTQAGRAIEEIEDVEDSGDLNDSWWDDWGADVVRAIVDVASAVAAVAGILALVVGWIPVIGQALAAVLGLVALIAGIVALAGSLALAATGHGSWGEVAMNVIAVATFGIGRALTVAARVSLRGAKGASRLAAGRAAARSPAWRAQQGLSASSSSRAAMEQMLGSPALANLSRAEARNMAAASRTQGWVPRAGDTWREIIDVGTDFRSNLQTVFSGQAWKEGVSQIPQHFKQIGTELADGNVPSALSRALGDSDLADAVSSLRGVSNPLTGMAEVSSHVNRATAHGGLSLGATAYGTYQTATDVPDAPNVVAGAVDSVGDLFSDDRTAAPGAPSDPAVPAR